MFTGIVQKTGNLLRMNREGEGWALQIACSPWPRPLDIGESVAVQGACFTVTTAGADSFTADVLDETLRRTALRALHEGSLVNLERALAVGDHLGGHIVTGHVDETGTLLAIRPAGRDVVFRLACSRTFAARTVEKGSVSLDGVSLTVTAVGVDFVEVALIPHTRASTSLRERCEGDPVNLESDILGKYVAKLTGTEKTCGITDEFLKENGFL